MAIKHIDGRQACRRPLVDWRRRAQGFRRDTCGVAAIEFAIIFPLMLIVYVGLVDVSNLISANRRVTLTANTLGDLVTQSPGEVTSAQIEGFFAAASPIMEPFPADSIALELYAFTKSSGSISLAWQRKNSESSCDAAPTPDAKMESLMTEDNDVIVSRTCYTWKPILGVLLGIEQTTARAELMLRPRQSARITCADCT